jgi:Barstar (barnase inhibitor)
MWSAQKRTIELDASGWADVMDFYTALKSALGSCTGHGNSPDAWVDSMIYGGMNAIEAPYVIRIAGTARCDEKLKDEIALLADVIREARAWKLEHYGEDVDVTFEINP